MRISDWSSDLCSSDLVASEIFDMSWFADKALFLIRKNNLGFSVPDGCIAVAECHPYEGKDHNLVIVRQQGHLLARRLLRPPHGDELALAAEAPDPRNYTPTLDRQRDGEGKSVSEDLKCG